MDMSDDPVIKMHKLRHGIVNEMVGIDKNNLKAIQNLKQSYTRNK